MKKTLLVLAFMGLGSMAFAQSAASAVKEAPKPSVVVMKSTEDRINTNTTHNQVSFRAPGISLYTETFSNGLAGENGAWVNNGSPASAIWEYRGPATTPGINTCSRGAFAGANGAAPPTSPTATNGYMVFDSDFLDNNGNPQGFGTGPAPTPHMGELVSPVIDLTGYPNVLLSFNFKFRRFVSDLFVAFSTDGVNWTDTVVVYGDAIGTPSNSPHTNDFFSAYVTAIGGSATAQFKFIFDGVNSHGNPNGSGYYYAAIDDIVITSAPDNDLVLDEKYLTKTGGPGNQQYYREIPQGQAQNDSILIGGKMTNLGSATQNNARVVFYSTRPSGVVDTIATASTSIAPGVQDSLTASTWYKFDKGLGLYDLLYEAKSDSVDDNPNDNFLQYSVTVSDTVYARDNDNAGGTGRWYGAAQNYEIGPMYEIGLKDTATSISVRWMSLTAVGSVVALNIYDTSDFTTPIVSKFVTLTASQIGQWATFGIPETELNPGAYLVTYETFSDSVLWAFDIDDPTADPLTVFVDPDNTGTWFWTTSIPMIRLNLKGAVECTDPFTVSIDPSSVQPAGCVVNNGQARVILPAGHNPGGYTITWNGTVGTDFRTDLAAGSYTIVVVNDTTGCEASTSVTISTADAPVVSVTGLVASNCSPASGEASIVPATGSTTDYNYAWSDGVAGTDKDFRNDLMAGTYTIVVTELATGCDTTVTIDITQVPGPDVTVNRLRNADCGVANGEAEVVPSTGATTDYNYNWSDGVSGTDKDMRNDLLSGVYSITVTELSTGCDTVVSVSISNIGGPSVLSSVIVDAACNGSSNGSIALTMDTIGTEPFTYVWSTGDTTTDGMLDNLMAGNYTVTVLDVNGCIGSDGPFVVGEPDAIVVGGTTDNNGEGCVTVSGGTAPYTYLWDNGETTECITVATGGSYGVTVTDANGCEQSGVVDIVVGLEDIRISSSVKVFPNPTNGAFNMVFNDLSGVHEISVFNPLGQVVDNRRVSLGGHNVTVEYNDLELRNGVYFIVVRNEAGAGATFRLVVR